MKMCFVLVSLAVCLTVPADPTVLEKADAAVRAAVPKAEADPTRPIYHFRAPAQWINDPNGPIQYKGIYHVFYQHNPYGDEWGNMHWGHARSKDLIHWEHLPIAIAPSKERGEDHVFSGCCTLNGDGKPMIFYTSIGRREPEQWAAIAQDDELIAWKKLDRPALTQADNGEKKIREWRDPCVFRDRGRTFMVTGGMLDQRTGCVQLYEAVTPDLSQWKRRGTLHQEPGDIECPLFFKLQDKWVLVLSIHGHAAYHTGTFDPDAGTFKSEASGMIDASDQFYAPNTFQDDNGRRILIGWVRGFKKGLGWNGCFSLPREVKLLPDGHLQQLPIEQTRSLFGDESSEENVAVAEGVKKLPAARGDAACLFVKAEPSKAFTLHVRVSDDGRRKVAIKYENDQLEVAGQKAPLKLAGGEDAVMLVVFLDKSVLEVYGQNGRLCMTRVIDANPADLNVELVAPAALHVEKLKTWPMQSAWSR
jgi:sucrose-6-phosphate hydrolase SacC (GH32 family)